MALHTHVQGQGLPPATFSEPSDPTYDVSTGMGVPLSAIEGALGITVPQDVRTQILAP